VYVLRVRPGGASGNAPRATTIEVQLADASLSRGVGTLWVVDGEATRATLTLARTAVSADDPRTVAVQAALFDAQGRPLPLAAALVDVDVGELVAVDADPLLPTLSWTLPARPPTGSAHVRVRRRDGGVLAEASVALTAGRPAQLAFTVAPTMVHDDEDRIAVVITATDVAGNVVDAGGTTLAATGGRVIEAAADPSSGRLVATIEPAIVDAATTMTLEARLGALRARHVVEIRPQRHPPFTVGLGLSAGTSGDVTAGGVDLSLLLRLPLLDGSLYAGVDAGLLLGFAPASLRSFEAHRAVPLAAGVAWRPMLGRGVGLHIAAAAGALVVDTVVDDEAAATTTFLTALTVGAFYDVGPGALDVVARLRWAPTPQLDNGFTGAPVGPGVVVGYRLGF
jgi:hypothetical protein